MTSDDDDLRQLFDDATADIRPHGTFEEIRSRTKKADPMTRPWLSATAAAAVIALAVGGAFYLTRDDQVTSPSTRPASPGPGSAQPVTTTRTVIVFFVGDAATGPRLFPENTTVAAPSGSVSAFALEAAKAAVSGKPNDPDYRSPWPAGTVVQGLGGCTDGCDIQVTLAGTSVENRPAGMSEQLARLAVDQVVRTVQAAMGRHDPVFFARYTSGGGTHRLDHVLGVDTRGSIGPLADDTALAPVQIFDPGNGEKVSPGDVWVLGLASTFEANVVWELLAGDAVVKHGHTTAAQCCTLSKYSFVIKGVAPGTYTLVVHDTDESGAGRPVNQDTKEIIVE